MSAGPLRRPVASPAVGAQSHIRRAIAAAGEARAHAGLAAEKPAGDVLTVVEDRLGLPVLFAPIEPLAGAHLRRAGGSLVVVSSVDAAVRRRFTIAHELGHDRLHDRPLQLDGVYQLVDLSDPIESCANHFAAHFLAPDAALERFLDEQPSREPTLELIARAANRFAISALAACIRLKVLGALGDHPERIERLERESRDGTHLRCFERLGLDDLDDGCARIGSGELRVPPAASDSMLTAYAEGVLDGTALTAAIGAGPAALEATLDSAATRSRATA